jgi:hypothetical protein
MLLMSNEMEIPTEFSPRRKKVEELTDVTQFFPVVNSERKETGSDLFLNERPILRRANDQRSDYFMKKQSDSLRSRIQTFWTLLKIFAVRIDTFLVQF